LRRRRSFYRHVVDARVVKANAIKAESILYILRFEKDFTQFVQFKCGLTAVSANVLYWPTVQMEGVTMPVALKKISVMPPDRSVRGTILSGCGSLGPGPRFARFGADARPEPFGS